jgi:hypothetical protein
MIALAQDRARVGEIDLRPGDVVKARRYGAFWHYGVYEGYDSVVVLLAGQGVARQTLAEFAGGSDLRRVDKFDGARLDHRTTLKRAQDFVGLPLTYNLAKRNCEHFARWCATGDDASHQVEAFATAAAVAATALAIVAKKPLIVAGIAALAAVAAVEYFASRESARVPVGPTA